MSERDELPEGWDVGRRSYGGWMLWFRDYLFSGVLHRSRAEAIAAAWRIVDVEKEAGGGSSPF